MKRSLDNVEYLLLMRTELKAKYRAAKTDTETKEIAYGLLRIEQELRELEYVYHD